MQTKNEAKVLQSLARSNTKRRGTNSHPRYVRKAYANSAYIVALIMIHPNASTTLHGVLSFERIYFDDQTVAMCPKIIFNRLTSLMTDSITM